MLIFDNAADIIAQTYKEIGKVTLGKVDCDEEVSVCKRYKIFKYPTIKLVRKGHHVIREYRGNRTLEDLITFMKNQLDDPVKEFNNPTELTTVESHKAMIIGM